MRDIAERVLDAAAAAGAEYADCRVVDHRAETVVVKNGRIAELRVVEDAGAGMRVLVDGAWGFVGTQETGGAALEVAARRAVAIARASARTSPVRVRLAAAPAVRGEYRTTVRVDPMRVPIEQRVELLLAADAGLAVAGITARTASVAVERRHQLFASSEGSLIDQTIVECGGGLDAMASDGTEMQVRSFPNSFGRQQLTAGWEAVEEMDLVGNAPRIAEETVALLTAPPCPAGSLTLILDATQAALQVHESCGHATELDRVLGYEAAYAGTSFLMPEMLGSFRYGSEQVSISADATSPGGLGTFGWDDDGVAASSTMLVDQGRFTGYLSSRETSPLIGLPSSGGTVRAESWNHLPLIRMTNINLLPGTSSLEEMIATTEHGVYLETNRSWSIDDRRLNFQFGTQAGWEIRDGRRLRLVRNPLYSGSTPEFWGSCDAIAGPSEWAMYGVVNCGKGQPSQVMHVGHGAAPCRFRNVAVRPA